ncbi:MAG: hypothetical protein J0M24_24885 [Verrucomicrobia bacterium]|nr:hypothetical protein [Verrucomicrobiota bacterium]
MSPRRRLLLLASLALVLAWGLAFGGFAWARATRVTPERISRYVQSVDWARLTPEQREKALRKLADLLNRLSPEDRRTARMDAAFRGLFPQLTTAEKELFLELTVPTGFNQMLVAFEQMPEDRRRRAIGESVRRLREARERAAEEPRAEGDTNAPPELAPELQEKVVQLGLKSFYESGSPDVKAEVAPLLEELQRNMESGRSFRQRRGPPGL